MHELFFPDGSCPSDSILQEFLKIAEGTDGRAPCSLCVSLPIQLEPCPYACMGFTVPAAPELCSSGACDTNALSSCAHKSGPDNQVAQIHRVQCCCEAAVHSLRGLALW